MRLNDLLKILMIIVLVLVCYEIIAVIVSIINLVIFIPLWIVSPQFWCILLFVILIIWYIKSKFKK